MANPGQGETFELLGFAWDVDAAWKLVAGRKPNGWLALDPLFAWAGDLIRIDAAHAASGVVDATLPALVVPLAIGGNLPIDGWHRMHKAAAAGAIHYPAHMLSAAEERAVRLRGGK